MKNKKSQAKVCPLCGQPYNGNNCRTTHHVYPKEWYGMNGPKVDMCFKCHCVEFNKLYPQTYVWTIKECLKNLADFCRKKGKKIFEVYPHLAHL